MSEGSRDESRHRELLSRLEHISNSLVGRDDRRLIAMMTAKIYGNNEGNNADDAVLAARNILAEIDRG